MKETEEKLVLDNMGLVGFAIRPFVLCEEDREDFFQIGAVSLIKAVNKFDVTNNIKFSTYAIHVIRNDILQELRRRKKHQNVISYDIEISNSGHDKSIFLSDTISDDKFVEDNLMQKCDAMLVREAVQRLNDRERKVVTLLYGLNADPMKQKDVANAIGITQAQISRINKAALQKMKKYIDCRW